MNVTEFSVNTLPAPTWRWLKVNDKKVSFPVEGNIASIEELMAAAHKETLVFDGKGDMTRLPFQMENGAVETKAYQVSVKENAEATVYMDFQSGKDAAGYLAVQTKAFVEKNGLLKLVQVHRLGEEFTLINDVKAETEENGRVEIIHVVFSGKDVNIGTEVVLKGDKSSVQIDTGYLVEKDHCLDVNYNIPQFGKKTRSDLAIKGVLRDSAQKTLRDTIDFKRGSCGSSGDENEDVLLMDDGIVNKSVPLILCTEEDVEGNHGASIGRIGEELLFYMESRGIKEEDIYEMMAKARLEAVIKLIPDEATVEELVNYNNGVEE